MRLYMPLGSANHVTDFEVEQDEMSRASPPVHLTRELWVSILDRISTVWIVN